ncbi:enoyl-CoA hydratase/isomerase family protein [Gulosibacter chungangensis]|uniref:Enoyl-CoA hydratase/isomerase family protein n=1 Tax=Gulosibacter chungangensis TaxID=979746 RepID=A0A7J5BG79_9MICO|nr:enoyl-CoA hydratase/isomerase family protein [Gulosibacter chungangensis]KAB1645118.1 enoyl-CoA hydratase/isomerase family protein [Gulosibacter chungangensis]
MSSVDLQLAAGIATITLNRADRLNALNVALAKELAEVATEAAASDAELVILTGDGRAFCAGGDAQEMAEAADRSAYLRELVGEANRAMIALREIPQPVIAKINGAVAGAGLGLVLTTDIAVAVDTAKFTPAYGAIGLSPDCGVTVLLGDAIGARRARDFLLTGRRIDAQTALDWGLVSSTASAEGLDEAVAEVAAAIRNTGPLAPTAIKTLLNASGTYADRLELERASISSLAGSSFAGAQLEAFVSK